ncbi:nitrate reductase [Vibrio sp. SCSIO 43136]|uniref:molybdopterin oxidoreductase family protein n=1 Tax=Vibrio sp. SCSIO 43136 TaxID=2819101 RepID=UPI002075426B|nr:nitrate reductase [Vibrio sp. SCSIO 43136]USD67558.1 nitrate reductase [Vibrio sp. SCSIO 43136]
MSDANQGWIKTTCAYCGVGCGVEARPKMSGELEIRGDKDHPSNYGKLCTKGIALGETVIQDGRQLYPQNRKTGEPLSWDQATQTVADKFAQAIEEHGPDSVAFYVSGQLLTEDYYLANKLIKGFMGTANIDSNSRLCMASSVVGHKRAFGSDTVPVCYEDLEQAELVVLVGSNLAWCHPVLFQRLRSAKQDNPNLKVVVVDPRRTDTSAIADQHLSIHSGADVALFNGLLSYLAANDHLDHEFIQNHTNQFEKAIEATASDTQTSLITGLSEHELNEFYRDFADTDKVITIYSQGVNQSTSGSDKVNSIINCHLATGKIGKEGTGPFSVTGQPNAMGGREVGALANTLTAHMEFENAEHLQLVSNFWNTNRLAVTAGLKAIDMFDAMAEGKIKAVWIMATNPVVSLPNSDKIKQALDTCPFVVVSDCIADTETSKHADLVLPAQGWSEKSGTVTNSERRISRQRKVLPSPGVAKPDWWIISQVGQKMGFESEFTYLHEGQVFKEYAELTTQGNLNGERDFNLIGLTQLDDKGYSRLTPQQWPVTKPQSEVVNQRLFANGKFFTPDNKARFIPVQYQAPQSETDKDYPLLLNSGRSRDHWHTMTRTGLATSLGEFDPEPYALLHPHTALKYRVSEGQLVKVSNAQGECLAKAKISQDIDPNQVFVPIHWNGATAKQSKPCALISPFTDSFSGQPEFKHTPVTIEPVTIRSEAALISPTALTLEGCDYWARQKISGGYLYRIASNLSFNELASQLRSQLEHTEAKQITFDGSSETLFATTSEDKWLMTLKAASTLQAWQYDQMIALYTQPYTAEAEMEFLGQSLAQRIA